MKKLVSVLVLLVVVLGAAYCAAGWWVGNQAQKQYEMMVDKKINQFLQLQKNNPYLEITKKSYDRGIFRSTAVTSVVLKLPGEEKAYKFNVANSIAHGPLVFPKSARLNRAIQPAMAVISTHLSGEGEAGDAIKMLLEKVPEFGSSEVITVINLDGSGESHMYIPAFTKNFPGKKGGEFTVNWGGLTSNSRFDFSLNDGSGSFSAPVFEITDSTAKFVVKNLKGDVNIRPGVKGLSVGDVNTSCDYAEFKEEKDGVPFKVESAGIQISSGVTGETVNALMLARFDKLTAADQSYGPFVLELELRKLDAATLVKFEQTMGEVQTKMLGKSNEEIMEALSPYYTQLFNELMAKSPEVELKQLKGTTPWGDFSSHLLVSVSSPGASITENPLAALTSLSANLDATMSERLLNRLVLNVFRLNAPKEDAKDPAEEEKEAAATTQQVVESLLAQNIIVRDNENLKTNASYSFGRLMVNGKPLNFPELLKTE